MKSVAEVQAIINANKPLDFSNLLSRSIDLYMKIWVQGVLHVLLGIALIIPLFIVFYLPFFMVIGFENVLNESYNSYEEISLYGGLVLGFSYLILIVGISSISTGLMACFFKLCSQADSGESISSNYFAYLKGPYLVKSIVLGLLTVGISIVAVLLCVLPIFYVMVPLSFINVVYALNPHWGVSDILKISFSIGNKKWLLAFGLIILASIMSSLGYLLCFVGIIATAYFGYMPQYVMYVDLMKNSEAQKSSQFLENTQE